MLLTGTISPISVVRTRIIVKEARLKPFSSHTPVKAHVTDKKGAHDLTSRV